VAHKTDHAALGATVAMLDVAIDSGFSDRHFEQDKDAENAFNEQVSELAKAVRRLESSLVGGGLHNLNKTAAKASLDRLWFRLQYTVRTKPPVQSNWLGAAAEEQERGSKWMNSWVKQSKDGPAKKVVVREASESESAEALGS
jgi:hypothetical protein